MSKKYNGEFDEVDVYQLGINSKKSNSPNEYDANPANKFVWETKTESQLDAIERDFSRGWNFEHKRQIREKNDKRVAEFKLNLPKVNDIGFIEFDSNSKKLHECKVIFVDYELGALLVQYIDNNRSGEYTLIGHGSHSMATWHYKKVKTNIEDSNV